MKKTLIVSLTILAIVLSSGLTALAYTIEEIDINEIITENISDTPSSWAISYVDQAKTLSLVPGHLSINYTQTISRAEYCALAVRLYEKIKGSEITERKTFVDTNDVNVEKMGALEVVTGVGNDRFAPDNLLTREQAAVVLARLSEALGYPLPEKASSFADNAQIASWSLIQVGQVQAAEIMSGIGNNMFSPKGSYSREQSIITMVRLYDMIK